MFRMFLLSILYPIFVLNSCKIYCDSYVGRFLMVALICTSLIPSDYEHPVPLSIA